LRIKVSITVTGNLQPNFAVYTADFLVPSTVVIPGRIILLIAQVVIHLGFQSAFSHALGELLEKAFFSENIFRRFITVKQLID